MLRKQRKLQPWRRFGYVILIIIKFGELLLWFSPRIIIEAMSNIRKGVSSDIQTPWSWLKNTRLRLIFSTSSQCWISDETLFLVFDILRDLRETASVLILPWSISQHSQDDLASSSSSPVPSPISVESPASQRSPRASPFILDVDSVISERHQVRDLFFLS